MKWVVFTVLSWRNKIELKQNLEINDVGKLESKKDNDKVKQIREDDSVLFSNENFRNTIKGAIS